MDVAVQIRKIGHLYVHQDGKIVLGNNIFSAARLNRLTIL